MGDEDGLLVSVILPTYGRPDFLQKAVNSVLEQTYENIELVVVDDHSPIPAEETLSPTLTNETQTIRIVRHGENKGANVARNTGIKEANGDLIAFLDDDDRWEPTKIERQVTVFQKADSTVGAVYTGQRIINDDGATTSLLLSEERGDITRRLLHGARTAPFSSVMVCSDVIQQAGLPDERFPCWQDREWYVRLSQYCEFEAIAEPLVIRHVGNHDQIGDNYIQKRDKAFPLFLKKYQPLAAEYGQISKQKMKSSLLRELGKHALRKGQYQESRKQLLKAAIQYPFAWQTYMYLVISASGSSGYRIARKWKRKYENYIFPD